MPEDQSPQPAEGNEQGQPTKTYTESEFNSAMAGMRRSMERKFAEQLESQFSERLSKWREEQGLTDDLIGEFQNKKTEAQRVAEENKTLKTKFAELEKKHGESSSRLSAILTKEAFRKALGPHKVINPDLTYLALKDNFELVGDELVSRNPDLGVQDVIGKFLKENDYLLAPTVRVKAGGQSPTGEVQKADPLTERIEQLIKG